MTLRYNTPSIDKVTWAHDHQIVWYFKLYILLKLTLSEVTADCFGISMAISFKLWTYLTLSKIGIRKLSPGSKMRWNRPILSVIQASCWGTKTMPVFNGSEWRCLTTWKVAAFVSIRRKPPRDILRSSNWVEDMVLEPICGRFLVMRQVDVRLKSETKWWWFDQLIPACTLMSLLNVPLIATLFHGQINRHGSHRL